MTRLYYSFVFGLMATVAFAQSYHYTPLQASGDIPLDFSTIYSDKLKIQEISLSTKLSKKEKRNEMSFHQLNEYVLDNYLTSGKVLYGDEVTNYVNEVLDKVLASDPELRSEIRLYVVRSDDFNAYTTNNGLIFVNIGLLAQLETEAQLAYVLSHEVIHYKNKHVRKTIAYEEQLKKISQRVRVDSEELAKKFYAFSKDQELECDQEGYEEYFKKSGYSLLAPYELMDIMIYAYLPFDNIEFDPNFVATDNYGITNKEVYTFNAVAISARDNVPDSLSTHPNVMQRRKALEEFAEKREAGEDYLISKDRFIALRNQCRYESLDIYLRTRKYDRAIYYAWLLQETMPDDQFLQQAIAYAIYGTSVYRNHYQSIDKINKEPMQEGELSRVRYMLKNIGWVDLNTLAVCQTYELYREHPENETYRKMFRDAVWELTHFHSKTLKDYQVVAEAKENEKKTSNENEPELKTGAKVKRLKNGGAEGSKTDITTWKTTEAFNPYLNDTLFTNIFTEMENRVEEFNKTLPVAVSGSKKTPVTLRELRDPNLKKTLEYPKKKENKGGLGIKNALMLTPKSYSLDPRSANNIDINSSTARQQEYVKAISETAQMAGLKTTMFDYKNLEENSAEMFNETQTLQLWYDEYIRHDDVHLIPHMHERVMPITQKYNTPYLVFNGSLNTKAPAGFSANKSGNGALILMFLTNPTMLPFIFAYQMIPSDASLHFTHVVDVTLQKDLMTEVTSGMQPRGSKGTVRAELYDRMNQITSKPKYK